MSKQSQRSIYQSIIAKIMERRKITVLYSNEELEEIKRDAFDEGYCVGVDDGEEDNN